MAYQDLSSIRVIVLGTGRVARIRARELSARSDARLIGFAGNPQRAASLAQEFGVQAIDDPGAVEADAVMICNENPHHARHAEAALIAGRHVSVDYPLALSFAEAQSLYKLAETRGRVLHAEHIDLLSPWYCAISENLSRIGALEALTWTDMSSRQPGGRDWVFSRSAGPTLVVHAALLSRMVRLAGPIAKVELQEIFDGSGDRFQRRITQAHLKFKSGALGQICDGIGLQAPGPSSQFWAYGSEGAIHADDRKQVRLIRGETSEELFLPRREGLFAQDIDWFLRRIRTGEEGYAPKSHVLEVMKAADQG